MTAADSFSVVITPTGLSTLFSHGGRCSMSTQMGAPSFTWEKGYWAGSSEFVVPGIRPISFYCLYWDKRSFSFPSTSYRARAFYAVFFAFFFFFVFGTCQWHNKGTPYHSLCSIHTPPGCHVNNFYPWWRRNSDVEGGKKYSIDIVNRSIHFPRFAVPTSQNYDLFVLFLRKAIEGMGERSL
jgi:hypothetical protein